MAGIALQPQAEPRYTTEVVLWQAPAAQPTALTRQQKHMALQAAAKLSAALRPIQEQCTAPYAIGAAFSARVTLIQQQITALQAGIEGDQAQVVPSIRRLAKAIHELRGEMQQRELHYLEQIRLNAQSALGQQIRTSAGYGAQVLALQALWPDTPWMAEYMQAQFAARTIQVDAIVRTAIFALDQPLIASRLTAVYCAAALPDQARIIGQFLGASMDARMAGVRLEDIQRQLRMFLTDVHNRLTLNSQQREYVVESAQYSKQRQVERLFVLARALSNVTQPGTIPDLPAFVQAIGDELEVAILAFVDRYDQALLADLIDGAGQQLELAVRIMLHHSHPRIQGLMQAVSQRWDERSQAKRSPADTGVTGRSWLSRDTAALRAILMDASRSVAVLSHMYGDDPETIPILLLYIAYERGS